MQPLTEEQKIMLVGLLGIIGWVFLNNKINTESTQSYARDKQLNSWLLAITEPDDDDDYID